MLSCYSLLFKKLLIRSHFFIYANKADIDLESGLDLSVLD